MYTTTKEIWMRDDNDFKRIECDVNTREGKLMFYFVWIDLLNVRLLLSSMTQKHTHPI